MDDAVTILQISIYEEMLTVYQVHGAWKHGKRLDIVCDFLLYDFEVPVRILEQLITI